VGVRGLGSSFEVTVVAVFELGGWDVVGFAVQPAVVGPFDVGEGREFDVVGVASWAATPDQFGLVDPVSLRDSRLFARANFGLLRVHPDSEGVGLRPSCDEDEPGTGFGVDVGEAAGGEPGGVIVGSVEPSG
jgi:hypothetical protein